MAADNLPIGTIMIWAGDPNALPPTWRVCNGTQLKKTDYAELYGTLGTRWDNDNGYSADFFSIPDLRGVFLRGVNDDRNDGYHDPNVDKRVRLKGDSTISMDSAGSYQKDDLKEHTHNFMAGGGSSGPRDAVSIDTRHEYQRGTYATGGQETRPVNAYVYYIIKVRA
jgi:microcystin-dependent protein